MAADLINPTPTIYQTKVSQRESKHRQTNLQEFDREEIDQLEVFEHIKDIKDPEHPYTLEQLKVIDEGHIQVSDSRSRILVNFTPTVDHCSMATLIGLCIKVKLMQSVPPRFKIDIKVSPGAHSTEDQVNKQLNDKERVAAALENPNLVKVINQCIEKDVP